MFSILQNIAVFITLTLIIIPMAQLKRNTAPPEWIFIDSSSEQDSVIQISPAEAKADPTALQEVLSPYQVIPEVPQITLTTAQMLSDPLELFAELEARYSQFGAIKITASADWNCPFCFGLVDKPVTVRNQILQELQDGKPFEQLVRSTRISEYKERAIAYSARYKFKTQPKGTNSESKRQHEYWNLVSNSKYQSQKDTVQYAADLPTNSYGSGFPTRKGLSEDPQFDYIESLYNLNNVYRSPTSLLRVIQEKEERISGISLPWMYVGMQFATFCWHVEDLFLNSLNYMHQGATKTWYIVPGHQKQLFDQYVKEHVQGPRRKNVLQKITLMVDPLQLMKAGIHIFKLHQRPHDYVLTFAKVYHCGFSHGYNVGEAVNYISCASIDVMKQAVQYYAERQAQSGKRMKSFVLSYEWVIYQTVNRSLSIPEKYRAQISRIEKDYRFVLDHEVSIIKSMLQTYGQFMDVRILDATRKYFSNMCHYCKNYLYLTSFQCYQCMRNLCYMHIDHCDCMPATDKKWVLIVRELNEDRKGLQGLVPIIEGKVVTGRERRTSRQRRNDRRHQQKQKGQDRQQPQRQSGQSSCEGGRMRGRMEEGSQDLERDQ